MFLTEKFSRKRPVISFEIFPPKKQSAFELIGDTIRLLSDEGPDFISVTCGAGGTGSIDRTRAVAAMVKKSGKTESVAHLTCVGAARETIRAELTALKEEGIENVLALRGDLPEGADPKNLPADFPHASDLVAAVKDFGGFCIAAACYPEGHVHCDDIYEDIRHLREKQEAGADFFISQLFFDNDFFYRFLDRARSAGVSVPITAGVMPILSRSQVERMIFLCGASLPSPVIRMLHRYEHDAEGLRAAGIERAMLQLEDLMHHGADGLHVYTMNHPDIARTAMRRLT